LNELGHAGKILAGCISSRAVAADSHHAHGRVQCRQRPARWARFPLRVDCGRACAVWQGLHRRRKRTSKHCASRT